MTASQAREVPTQWRPIVKAKTYELVLDRIEEQILTGELTVGDRLPPERDLAVQLGVSRPAVREALRALQVQGAVRSGVGTGPDAGTIVVSTPDNALSRLLRLHVQLGGFDPGDVVEVRVMLERTNARLAAAHATSHHLHQLAGVLARLADPALTPDCVADLDDEFHRAVAAAGASRLVDSLAGALRGSRPPITPGGAPDQWQRVRVDFGTVYDRIAARDGTGAADALDQHLRHSCLAIGSLHPRA